MDSVLLTFEITSASVLQRIGSDRVSLVTTERSPTPLTSKQPLSLDFPAAYDTGPDYVRELGVRDNLVEVIRVR